MSRFAPVARIAAVSMLLACPAEAQWPPESFTNLKVLPRDISRQELTALAITLSFRQEGIERGTARYRELRERYGPTIFAEPLAFPSSATACARLAEAYVRNGDTRHAIESYERALKLDPNNRRAKEQLEKLRGSGRVE